MTSASVDAAEVTRADVIDSVVSPQAVALTLFVSSRICYFAGHFSQFPILPGVVQLDWAVRYAREYLLLTLPVMAVDRLKFTWPIQPNMQVKLTIEAESSGKSAAFRFWTDSLTVEGAPVNFSQGRLVYG